MLAWDFYSFTTPFHIPTALFSNRHKKSKKAWGMENSRWEISDYVSSVHLQMDSSGTSVVVELNQRIKEGPLLQLVSEQKAQLHSEALAKNKGEKI